MRLVGISVRLHLLRVESDERVVAGALRLAVDVIFLTTNPTHGARDVIQSSLLFSRTLFGAPRPAHVWLQRESDDHPPRAKTLVVDTRVPRGLQARTWSPTVTCARPG